MRRESTTGRLTFWNTGVVTGGTSPERAACLTRAGGPENLARLAQLIPLMANVEVARDLLAEAGFGSVEVFDDTCGNLIQIVTVA